MRSDEVSAMPTTSPLEHTRFAYSWIGLWCRYRIAFDLLVTFLASKDFWASSTAAECLLVH
jgi:hypothetical protein